MLRVAAVTAALMIGAAAPGAATGATPTVQGPVAVVTAPVESPLIWRPCTETTMSGAPLDCTTLHVPLDHRKPDGRTITIGVARLDSTGDGRRILFVNGGGPGISGVKWLVQFGDRIPAALRREFTIVAMDPRGLANGTLLRCFTPATLLTFTNALATWPVTPEGRRATVSALSSFADSCRRNDPTLSRHMGTEATAADLELLRRATGQQRLHYWGTSYGTLLGAAYATAHPARTGRMILDSVVTPHRSWADLVAIQARGAMQATHRWARTCDTRPSCPFRRQAFVGLEHLVAELNADASPAQRRAGHRPGDELAMGVRSSLFYGYPYRRIDRDIRQARRGTVTPIRDDGPMAFTSTQWATRCTDGPDPGLTRAGWPAHRRDVAARYPMYGAPLVWQTVPCIGARGEQLRVGSRRTAPLLLNGVADPATPLSGARVMARQFPRSSLAVWRGRGHGVLEHGMLGSGGCTRVVVGFLVSGERPSDRARCS